MKLRLQEAIERFNDTRPSGEPVMTQARLAELVGTTQSLVSKHQNGHVVPQLRLLSRYAEVLGCAVDDLFSDADDMRGVA